MAQWIRIRSSIKGVSVQLLIREQFTYCGANKPVSHNYWAQCATINEALTLYGASLVAQWWRSHLQCRRPQFDSWVGRPCFDSWVGKTCWRRDKLPTPVFLGFPGGSAGKESTCDVWDLHLEGLHASTTEAHAPRACALQKEKPPQWQAIWWHRVPCLLCDGLKIIFSPQLLLQQRVTPTRCNYRKPMQSKEDPVQTK